MKTIMKMMLVAAVCLMWLSVQADDAKPGTAKPAMDQMPPMGKPAEMDNVLKVVGTWGGDLQMRMDEKSPYASTACTMKFESILDGCAMTESASSTMMGMPFKGFGVLTYDREMKKWSQSWIDNMSASIYNSTGDWKGNQLTMTGGGKMMGKDYLMKEVTTMVSDTTMTWAADVSYDGGKTWYNSMKISYKKKM